MSIQDLEGWQSFKCDPPAESSAIEAFVTRKLPADYVEFLRGANGGEGPVGESSYVRLWRVEELATLNADYNVDEAAPGLLVIGSDGGSEAYAFDFSRPDVPVVCVPWVVMERDAIWYVAPSFRAFLAVLALPIQLQLSDVVADGGRPRDVESVGAVYFIEVFIAAELLDGWVGTEPGPVTDEARRERLIQYAINDA